MKIKSIKSVGRKNVYDISVDSDNYDEQQYVLKNGVITHNTGIMYSADTVIIVGRRQNKKGTEIEGYDFVLNIEKSRFVKEKTKIPITVTWEGGIEKYSGLRDIAMAGSYIVKPANGWYQAINPETGEELGGKVREKETLNEDFWKVIFSATDFKEFIKATYQIGQKPRTAIDFDKMEEPAE